jgi:PrcB C-terminal
MKKIFTLLLLALAVASCKINKASQSASTFEVLKQEAYGGWEEKSNIVIKSQGELTSLYKELGQENVPTVDFKKNTAVALFMGQKSTGGYSIGIKSINVKGDTAIIKVLETRPEPMTNATMALTTPYCIALIPKTEKVVFE